MRFTLTVASPNLAELVQTNGQSLPFEPVETESGTSPVPYYDAVTGDFLVTGVGPDEGAPVLHATGGTPLGWTIPASDVARTVLVSMGGCVAAVSESGSVVLWARLTVGETVTDGQKLCVPVDLTHAFPAPPGLWRFTLAAGESGTVSFWCGALNQPAVACYPSGDPNGNEPSAIQVSAVVYPES